MKFLTQIALWFVIIGALNWGLVGIFSWNLVATLLGDMTFLSRLVYILVGASAVWLIIDMFRFKDKPEITK